jgi:hypothetical protein
MLQLTDVGECSSHVVLWKKGERDHTHTGGTARAAAAQPQRTGGQAAGSPAAQRQQTPHEQHQGAGVFKSHTRDMHHRARRMEQRHGGVSLEAQRWAAEWGSERRGGDGTGSATRHRSRRGAQSSLKRSKLSTNKLAWGRRQVLCGIELWLCRDCFLRCHRNCEMLGISTLTRATLCCLSHRS